MDAAARAYHVGNHCKKIGTVYRCAVFAVAGRVLHGPPGAGDPLRSYYGESVERMSPQERETAIHSLGLDQPIYKQYGIWLQNAFDGDWGISFKYKQPVTSVLGSMYQNTLLLGGLAYVCTFGLALLLGVFCALHEDRFVDKLICKIGTITNCIPSFWVSLVLILIFSVNLGWLPSSGAYALGRAGDILSRLRHLILPLSVLVLSHLWYYAYMVRNKLMEEIRQDYVLLAKAKGLGRRQHRISALPAQYPAHLPELLASPFRIFWVAPTS